MSVTVHHTGTAAPAVDPSTAGTSASNATSPNPAATPAERTATSTTSATSPVDTLDRSTGPATAPTAHDAAALDILLTRTRAKVDTNLAQLRTAVVDLKAEISGLERQNGVKEIEIRNTISQIETRKAEIQRQQDNKRTIGILGAFFGMPMVTAVSIVQMQNDDSRIRQLQASLNGLRQEQNALLAKKQGYERTAATLGAQVSVLASEAAKMAAAERAPVPDAARNFVELAKSAQRFEQVSALTENLGKQVELLTTIRNAGLNLGAALDGVLRTAQSELLKASQLLAASLKEVETMVRFFENKDPNHAALKWLANSAAANLVGRALPGESAVDKQVRDEIKKRLAAAMVAGVSAAPPAS